LPHELADANGAPAGELLRDILYIGWFAGGPLRFRTNGISRLCTMYSRTGSLLLLLTHSAAKTFLGLWQIYQAHIYVQLVKETDRGGAIKKGRESKKRTLYSFNICLVLFGENPLGT